MTKNEKKEAYKAKQRAAEAARRAALRLPPYTPTGRTPSGPNIQNIPVRTEAGRQITAAFRDEWPVPGSQQWAETYRDNLGESFD
jgi:hypothetical protein